MSDIDPLTELLARIDPDGPSAKFVHERRQGQLKSKVFELLYVKCGKCGCGMCYADMRTFEGPIAHAYFCRDCDQSIIVEVQDE